MADVEGKKLTELRVIDLKTELERRGLDKTGNKAALLERLAKAIIEEGGNPDECLIIPSGGTSRAAVKKPVEASIMVEDVLETEIQKEEFNNDFDGLDKHSKSPIAELNNTEELVINISTQPEEFELECQDPEPEPEPELELEPEPEPESEPEPKQLEQVPVIEEKEKEKEKEEEKKPFIPSEESSNVSGVETNGIDNEDSINLTIGEDEENLLVEESESNDRLKDGGAKKLEENNDSISSSNKKGDSKGSGRVENDASNKEGSSSLASGPNATGLKNKQDGEGCKSGDLASKGPKRDEKDKSAIPSINASSRNLWVSGLSSTTRATDLKQTFSKYGKVIGAKVVTNARTPGARCYGYVTMSTSDDAEQCIEHLHRTELHGRVISVEKAKGDAQQNHNRKREIPMKLDKKDEKEKLKESEPSEKEEEKNEEEKKGDEVTNEAEEKDIEQEEDREKRETSSENKDEGSLKDCDTRSTKSNSKKSDRGNSREDKKRSWDRSRTSRSKSRERHRRDNEERERQRIREKERVMREEKRRRREDMERQRAIEREAARLEREREKLRLERERIEQEKAELLRLERERQKVEREKLERERLELKRQQMRLEENRRVPPPPALKRTVSERREPRDVFVEPDRKRVNVEHASRRHSPTERVPERRTDVMERVSDRRMDTSSVPSRYEGNRSKEIGMQKNFKRGNEFVSRNNRDEQFTEVARGGGGGGGGGGGRGDAIVRRDSRPNQNNMDHRPVKERYERPSTFGRDREVHRSDDNHRNSRDNHNRYDNTKPNNPHTNRPTGWHSGPPSKPFNPNNRNEQSGWNNRSSDSRANSRWNNSNNMGNNMGHQRSNMYQGGPNQSYGMSQGNSGSYDRFEPYKGSMQNMRKY